MPRHVDQNSLVVEQFTQQAKPYADLTGRRAGAEDPLAAALRLSEKERILDVGCGPGRFLVSVAQTVAYGVGVDLTPAMLEIARGLSASHGIENLEWRLGDSLSLPVADAAFDVVTSRAMLHHAADPTGTLAEMRRTCRPGGRVAVLDLTPDPVKAPAFDAIELLRDPSHARALTSEDLRALGAGVGLTELQVRSVPLDYTLEATLSASVAEPHVLERVRDLYRRDALTAGDAFGMKSRLEGDVLWVTYPMTLVVWSRP